MIAFGVEKDGEVMACFRLLYRARVLAWYSPGGTEENFEKVSQAIVVREPADV